MSEGLISKQAAIEAVESEPELPGDMPMQAWVQFVADPEGSLRACVRATKQGIKARVEALSVVPTPERLTPACWCPECGGDPGEPPTLAGPSAPTADLRERLHGAALELERVQKDWAGVVNVPTLAAGQQNTINLLREAAEALSASSPVPSELRCTCNRDEISGSCEAHAADFRRISDASDAAQRLRERANRIEIEARQSSPAVLPRSGTKVDVSREWCEQYGTVSTLKGIAAWLKSMGFTDQHAHLSECIAEVETRCPPLPPEGAQETMFKSYTLECRLRTLAMMSLESRIGEDRSVTDCGRHYAFGKNHPPNETCKACRMDWEREQAMLQAANRLLAEGETRWQPMARELVLKALRQFAPTMTDAGPITQQDINTAWRIVNMMPLPAPPAAEPKEAK